ncbi:hypothetical protein [Calothrix sp. NIES-3974]|uniref:hypothetical protein n=1 Tax=Calothrix sp. NIES-3974 TaxID=2005462 RepID=UPI0012FD9663|nr:hypothetical protein [Calothrix sp. NIES-3974]
MVTPYLPIYYHQSVLFKALLTLRGETETLTHLEYPKEKESEIFVTKVTEYQFSQLY